MDAQPLRHDPAELIGPVLPGAPGPVVLRVWLQPVQLKQPPVDGHKTDKVESLTCGTSQSYYYSTDN